MTFLPAQLPTEVQRRVRIRLKSDPTLALGGTDVCEGGEQKLDSGGVGVVGEDGSYEIAVVRICLAYENTVDLIWFTHQDCLVLFVGVHFEQRFHEPVGCRNRKLIGDLSGVLKVDLLKSDFLWFGYTDAGDLLDHAVFRVKAGVAIFLVEPGGEGRTDDYAGIAFDATEVLECSQEQGADVPSLVCRVRGNPTDRGRVFWCVVRRRHEKPHDVVVPARDKLPPRRFPQVSDSVSSEAIRKAPHFQKGLIRDPEHTGNIRKLHLSDFDTHTERRDLTGCVDILQRISTIEPRATEHQVDGGPLNMQVTVFTDEVSKGSPHRAIDLAHQWGVSHIEIRMLSAGRFPDVPDSELTGILDKLDSCGMSVSGVSPGLFKIRDDDPRVEQDLAEKLPRACEWARRLGTDLVSCFAFLRSEGSVPARVVDLVGRMAETTRGCGCKLVLENEAVCWGNTGREASDIIRRIGTDRIGLCWDPGNSAHAGTACPFPEEYDEVRDLVRHVHMKNYNPDTDGWTLLDSGAVDWRGQLHALSDDGYRGFVVVETHLDAVSSMCSVTDDTLSVLERNTLHNLLFVRDLMKDAR